MTHVIERKVAIIIDFFNRNVCVGVNKRTFNSKVLAKFRKNMEKVKENIRKELKKGETSFT